MKWRKYFIDRKYLLQRHVTLSEKITYYRTMNEISRQVMATEMRISLHQMRGIEDGTISPDTESMDRLITYTSIPYDTWVNPRIELPTTLNNNPRKQRERLRQVINEKADGNLSEFARLVEVDKTTLSRMLSGERRMNDNHLRQIEIRTRARLEWLKSGREPAYHAANWSPENDPTATIKEGAMLAGFMDRHGISWVALGKQMGVSKAASTQYQHTQGFHAAKKVAIMEALKKLTSDEGLTEADVFATPPNVAVSVSATHPAPATGKILPVNVLERDAAVRLMRIPVRARAGFGYTAYFNAPVNEQEFMDVSSNKLYPGVKAEDHKIVEVNGDSMEPQLQSGFEMLAYKLPAGQFPKMNKIVMVDFHEELVVKRLVGIDWVDRTVTLRSDNGGTEMRIPMDEIRGIWHIYDYYRARL